jgi:DNA (cytosine-5)-methyltransferase 1
MLTYGAIAKRYRPRWLVWENVPGVLSSNGGRDFGTFLGMLAELRYGFAYRVLDAQYFGVAQRRRRVFVVGYLGDWHRAAAVLFERQSLCGHPTPSREAGQAIARGSQDRLGSGSIPEVAETLIATDHKGPGHNRDHNFITQPIGFGAQMSNPQTDMDLMQTLNAKNPMAVAFEPGSIARNAGPVGESPLAPTLRREMGDNQPAVRYGMQVRRLTPVECERLQGFPDNYTNIPWRKKPESPDGPRYKALGNSMAVPVMRWIGERIAYVDGL